MIQSGGDTLAIIKRLMCQKWRVYTRANQGHVPPRKTSAAPFQDIPCDAAELIYQRPVERKTLAQTLHKNCKINDLPAEDGTMYKGKVRLVS